MLLSEFININSRLDMENINNAAFFPKIYYNRARETEREVFDGGNEQQYIIIITTVFNVT